MNSLFVFVLTVLVINCYAFNMKDIGNGISELTSELGLTDNENTEQSKLVSDLCSQKCSKDIEELKKNMSELYMTFLAIRAEFAHLNQHMIFHEKALKHIAVWGHKQSHHNRDHNFEHKNPDSINPNGSSINSQQNVDSAQDLSSKVNTHHIHRHHNDEHHRTHHNRHHCKSCNPQSPDVKDNSFEKSSEEQPKDWKTSIVASNSDSKLNTNITLNDSQTNFSPKSAKRTHSSKHSIQEQMHFQSMETEFKDWFIDMLNDIHSKDSIYSQLDNQSKAQTHPNEAKEVQKSIDDMESALTNEELVFATCNMRPNRHIALLNQQDIEGTVSLWQLKHNRGPLHLHIKLKGFKVANHEHNHPSELNRRTRESNLMPVEVESDEPIHPIGHSHTHAFHVHEFSNFSRDCQSVGSHYNPLNFTHGGPFDVIRHVGDLGNIRCDRNGEIDTELSYSHVSLSGEHSIINRSLVIHSNADDLGRNPNSASSSSTGSSGVRIACCIIEEVKTLPKEVDSQTNIGSDADSVAAPVIGSKRRRDTRAQVFRNKHQNRFEDSKKSKILKKISEYENEYKYKTLMNFNERQRFRFDEQLN